MYRYSFPVLLDGDPVFRLIVEMDTCVGKPHPDKSNVVFYWEVIHAGTGLKITNGSKIYEDIPDSDLDQFFNGLLQFSRTILIKTLENTARELHKLEDFYASGLLEDSPQ